MIFKQCAPYIGRNKEFLKIPHAVLEPARIINLIFTSLISNIDDSTVVKTQILSAKRVNEDTLSLFVRVKIFHNPSYGNVNGEARKPSVANR